MKTPVSVITADPYLFQKIRLALRDVATVTDELPSTREVTVLYDIDRPSRPLSSDGTLNLRTMSRSADADLKIPFSLLQIEKVIAKNCDTPLLSLENKTARLREKAIKLTELEAALLQRLYKANGSYVSREELLSTVFDGAEDGGIINVYIHYLRAKLEAGGEKIILSSRMRGYKIDERYLGGNYAKDN